MPSKHELGPQKPECHVLSKTITPVGGPQVNSEENDGVLAPSEQAKPASLPRVPSFPVIQKACILGVIDLSRVDHDPQIPHGGQ